MSGPARRRARKPRRASTSATRRPAPGFPVRLQASITALEPRRGRRRRAVRAVGDARADLQHVVERPLGDERASLPSSSTTTLTRLRTKSNGISASFATTCRDPASLAARIASSSGLAMPVSRAALQAPSSSTSADGAPGGIVRTLDATTPSVSVPVLSVQRTSMLPRFSIA